MEGEEEEKEAGEDVGLVRSLKSSPTTVYISHVRYMASAQLGLFRETQLQGVGDEKRISELWLFLKKASKTPTRCQVRICL